MAARLRCTAAAASIRRGPALDAQQEDQLLFGEDFAVEREQGGWVFGCAERDGYEGWVEAAALGEPGGAASHWVAALRTYGFPEPDKKSTPPRLYSMNALVRAEEEANGFVRCRGAGWIFAGHLRPLGEYKSDFVAMAERFIGAPYLWGGRESLGLDCSGLVQQALYACGVACPRDSEHQAALGRPVEPGRLLRRGDLAFWAGHVGIMVDEARMIHATGAHMDVRIEALDSAAGRGRPTSVRRL